MYGGLSREGLNKLERKIDKQLNGRDPKSSELEKELQNSIGNYSYEVEYHNLMHKNYPYKNKYGTPTPLQYRAGLSLANFMANGIPVEKNNFTIPEGKHPVTSLSMNLFLKSFEALLHGNPSKKDTIEIMSYDPNPKELISSVNQQVSKMNLFSSKSSKLKEESNFKNSPSVKRN